MVQKLGPIRVKSRSSQPVVRLSCTGIEYNNGVPTGTTYAGSNVTVDTGLVEKIVYTCVSPGNRLLSNMCIHTKDRSWYSGNVNEPMLVSNKPQYNNLSYSECWSHVTAATAHGIAVTAAKASFGITQKGGVLGASAQAFINDATSRLRPDLTTVSIPNFLAELDDVKRMFQLVKKGASLVHNVAGAHLNYKFGWKPFIGDLQNLYNGVFSLRQKLEAWEKSINVLFSKSATCLADTTTKSGSAPVGPHWVTWTGTVTRLAKAHIKWKPQPLAVMQPFEKVLRAILDTLGFELNPRIVWDALPFTFVLDWFFDIGSWLGRFKLDTLELPIAYVDSCVDYKEVMRIESQYHEASAIWTPQLNLPAWTTEENYFERRPIFADYATFCGLGGRIPKLGQMELLLSLAIVLGVK